MDARTQSREGDSLFGLIAGLREDVRNLFREEVRLAKTEVSEKAARFGRNAVHLAIGSFIALLAVVCLLKSEKGEEQEREQETLPANEHSWHSNAVA